MFCLVYHLHLSIIAYLFLQGRTDMKRDEKKGPEGVTDMK